MQVSIFYKIFKLHWEKKFEQRLGCDKPQRYVKEECVRRTGPWLGAGLECLLKIKEPSVDGADRAMRGALFI